MIKNNGDIIPFLKQKDYIMVNNCLGEGSFGKTVLLQDPYIDELFVAKKYEPEFEEIRESFYKNFLDEIKILHKLNHRNIVRVYNYYAYDNIFTGYILMEYIEGQNIQEYISEYIDFLAEVSIDEVFVQLIDGFKYIEQNGVLHRDIREGNILIDKTGVVKIIDFGIGKFFKKQEENTDSLFGQINRANSDTLPQEYYDGTYTSQTDMFYLAELFNRLLKNAKYSDDINFSYQNILDKMMQKQPDQRYNSFSEIQDAIGKHDFSNMNISESDKTIYQSLSNLIYDSLSAYTDERKFNYDASIFISRMEKALKDNLFEDVIQRNEDIIRCIVLSNYRYSNRINIPCRVVKSFLDWFKGATQQSQKLILNNLVSKLMSIRIDQPDPDLPF